MLKENTLPIQVDPFRFADNAICLQGTMYIKDLQRLASGLYANDGEIKANIEFGVDRQGIHFLRGQITACLTLQCQRCLEPFGYEIESRFLSGVVRSEEEANQLPKGYDQLIVKEDRLVIQDVVEDELIVNLPIVPMHQVNDCKLKLPLEIETNEPVEVGKENPFKVIEFLKREELR